MTPIDFGRHSQDYASFRSGYPGGFYDRLQQLIELTQSSALDLACGPGTITLELARRGARVIGVDRAPELIERAVEIADAEGLADRADFFVRLAESTGFDDEQFDLITAGQCWHWFDGTSAFSEARRMLKPGGLLAIAYYSYLVEKSDVARESEALVLEFNPDWDMAGSTGIFDPLTGDAGEAGFDLVETFSFVQDELYSHLAWRGRMRTSNGVGSGPLSDREVTAFDAALENLLCQNYPDPMQVPHRMWCMVARKPG